MPSASLGAVALALQALLQGAGVPSAFSGQWTAGGTPGTPGRQDGCTLTLASGALANHTLLLLDTGAAQEAVFAFNVAGTGPYTASFITQQAHALPVAAVATPFFQLVDLDEPPTFNGQSPVCVALPTQLALRRYTLGAGSNRDREQWTLDIYVDRTSQTFAQARTQIYQAVDVLRTTFEQHVTLADTSAHSSILQAALDGAVSRLSYRQIEGTLYRWLQLQLIVFEQYTTPITA